ncbi:hypothetical protein FACS1894184_20290 [Clostridia bacterium]|nr:hypothetical protein FACS1894184_20290 [Clostridia bacterium]
MNSKCVASAFCSGNFSGCEGCVYYAADESKVNRDGMRDAWMPIEEEDCYDILSD